MHRNEGDKIKITDYLTEDRTPEICSRFEASLGPPDIKTDSKDVDSDSKTIDQMGFVRRDDWHFCLSSSWSSCVQTGASTRAERTTQNRSAILSTKKQALQDQGSRNWRKWEISSASNFCDSHSTDGARGQESVRDDELIQRLQSLREESESMPATGFWEVQNANHCNTRMGLCTGSCGRGIAHWLATSGTGTLRTWTIRMMTGCLRLCCRHCWWSLLLLGRLSCCLVWMLDWQTCLNGTTHFKATQESPITKFSVPFNNCISPVQIWEVSGLWSWRGVCLFIPGCVHFIKDWQNRNNNHRHNHQAEILLHKWQVSKKESSSTHEKCPQKCTSYIEGCKSLVCHVTNASHKGRKSANDRDKTSNDNRLASILSEESFCLLDWRSWNQFCIQSLLAQKWSNRIVDSITQNGSNDKDSTEEEYIQLAKSSQSTRSKEKGISRQERRQHQSRFAKDNAKE